MIKLYKASAKRYNVTFAELVRYILDQHATGKALGGHLTSQNELCRVCQLRWDVLYRALRDVNDDADY